MKFPTVLDRLKRYLRGKPGYLLLRISYHLLGRGERRNVALLRLRRPANLFQPYPTTSENRYPQIFRFVREQLGDPADMRLLSFGCATGEEVFTLRRYFPLASIKGIDIDFRNIAQCRTRLKQIDGPGLSFETAGSASHEEEASYDAIFAMAVFRHGDLGDSPPLRCDHLIRFADFEQLTTGLARCLKPGGLLIIRHANFRFVDTVVSAGFTPIIVQDISRSGKTSPLYDSDNRRIDSAADPPSIFRKLR